MTTPKIPNQIKDIALISPNTINVKGSTYYYCCCFCWDTTTGTLMINVKESIVKVLFFFSLMTLFNKP